MDTIALQALGGTIATTSAPAGSTAGPASSPQDLERLRQLVDQHSGGASSVDNTTTTQAVGTVDETRATSATTIGDSILDSMVTFRNEYDQSIQNIENRIERIADTKGLDFGTQMGELIELQLDVGRWSMSVTGVDNATKAGTNTLKELSRGG